MSRKTRRQQRGFTLVEMGVTLAIVGILLTGLIMALSAQQDATREAQTRRQLAQAREALYGFAMSEGRLPCPADPTIASGAAGAGEERFDETNGCIGAAVSGNGVLPWATLGLAEFDPYGFRFSYRVDLRFARPVEDAPSLADYNCDPVASDFPSQSAFALCSRGGLEVRRLAGASAIAGVLPLGLPAIILSHGPNGAGAYTTAGTQVPGGSADELENSDGDTEFRFGTRRDDFDDELEWIVPAILKHRMVQAGRLP